ncbi:Clr5 domain-containing protein [Xylogone sp. PMI_703]|nr:Clr5 domain-containing protein [Xylogone sp. PMI_703]
MESTTLVFAANPCIPMKRQHTKSEWEAKCDIIKQLYMDKHLSLPKVMKIMQTEHNFKATARMYKQRLDEWGFRKNCNADEMKRILHSIRKREALGSQGEQMTPKEASDYHRLVKYMNRKFSRPMLAHTSLARTIRAPKTLEDSEILFSSISNYISGSFDDGTWAVLGTTQLSNNKYRGETIVQMSNYLRTAIDIFNTSDSCFLAGSILSKAFSLVDQVLLEEHPGTLTILISFVLGFRELYPDIIRLLISYFSDYASSIFPSLHPLRTIFTQLGCLDSTAWDTVLSRAWMTAFDQVGKFIGLNHAFRLRMLTFSENKFYEEESGFHPQSTLSSEMAWYQLHNIEVPSEILRVFYTRVNYELRLHPCNQGRKALALQIIQLAEAQFHTGDEVTEFQVKKAAVLEFLVWIYENEDQRELAERYLRESIEIYKVSYGRTSHFVLSSLNDLLAILMRGGKGSKAREVRQEIYEIVNEFGNEAELDF